ncbi:MAG: ATP-dependent DNA helicase [Candidatus Aenigmarchaeota archaeon]|nr:ATP-dependent DNA helicase [Candidatus Aenigmarchaeota archaeon]
MLFPFSSIRPQQKQFMDDVRHAIEEKKHLIANAPTGLGKTAASLSPALEYALQNGKTIFFLTPRHSQHEIALETLKKLREHAEFRVADMIGKKWLCSMEVSDFSTSEFTDFCRSMVKDERCPFYKAVRTDDRTVTERAKAALRVLNNEFLHAEEFKRKFSASFCSYELLMEAAKSSTVIIADYYHIFSPARAATLARIKKEPEDIIFIVDEAHNLPSRVRDLMSQKITTFSLLNAEKEAKLAGMPEAANIAGEIYNALNGMVKLHEKEGYISKEDFLKEVERRVGSFDSMTETLDSAAQYAAKQRKRSYVASLLKFMDSWSLAEEGYARIIRKELARSGKSFVTLSLACLDPAMYTKEIITRSHSTILMSGTLFPQEMYRNILGLPEGAGMKSYDSPFKKENRLNLIVPGITTKYSQRTDDTYRKIASYISSCVNAVKGNCAVFFPSYAFRDAIYPMIKNTMAKPALLEEREADKEGRKALYNQFVSMHKTGAVLLGVQAGSFSEGIDLAGDFLNGVIVVGIPLERPDLETKSLIDYYDLKFSRGWDYGYSYPAMIRTIQAAGRCIRTENDRGVCIFMDERFLWGNYRKVFPSDFKFTVTDTPEREIREFWKN